jgi:hypothetical protein
MKKRSVLILGLLAMALALVLTGCPDSNGGGSSGGGNDRFPEGDPRNSYLGTWILDGEHYVGGGPPWELTFGTTTGVFNHQGTGYNTTITSWGEPVDVADLLLEGEDIDEVPTGYTTGYSITCMIGGVSPQELNVSVNDNDATKLFRFATTSGVGNEYTKE